jgi:hypothetical protein
MKEHQNGRDQVFFRHEEAPALSSRRERGALRLDSKRRSRGGEVSGILQETAGVTGTG